MICAMFSMGFSSKERGRLSPAGVDAPGWVGNAVSGGDGAFDASGVRRDGPLHRVGGVQTERQTGGDQDDGQRRDDDVPRGASPVEGRPAPAGQRRPRTTPDDAAPSSRTTPRRRYVGLSKRCQSVWIDQGDGTGRVVFWADCLGTGARAIAARPARITPSTISSNIGSTSRSKAGRHGPAAGTACPAGVDGGASGRLIGGLCLSGAQLAPFTDRAGESANSLRG